MRVTNRMVNHGALKNMQRSQASVGDTTTTLTTGKKIQKASEDPVIAMRALKLRTTVDQLAQFKDKNIKDADSWMMVTENSLHNVVDRLNDVYNYCVQGANDTFETDDKQSIADSLQALKGMIYSEGSATYAGRYIYSGFRTGTDLTFATQADVKVISSYDINQKLTCDDFQQIDTVTSPMNYDNVDGYLDGSLTYTPPRDSSAYIQKLAYENIDYATTTETDPVTGETKEVPDSANTPAPTFDGKDLATLGFSYVVKGPEEKDSYYDVGDDEVAFIPETGELVYGKNAYDKLKETEEISMDYTKSEFKVGDLRPDHYFNCVKHEIQPDGSIKDIQFDQPEDGQKLQYEVNFSQFITVNTEGRDAITHDMGNKIDQLSRALTELDQIETTIKKLNSLKDDSKYKNDEDALKKIDQYLKDADVEMALKREKVTKLFEHGETWFTDFANKVGALQADVGTRMNKLDMIANRVSEQYNNFDELKSANEDKETEEAIIEFNEAQVTYNASLAATSNILKTTLLDYL